MFIMLLLAIYSMALVEEGSLPLLVERFHGRVIPAFLFIIAFLVGVWAIYPFFANAKNTATTSIIEGELGQVDISLEALRNMVREVAIQQDGVEDIKTELTAGEGGVFIFLRGKVRPTVVIPRVTEELQSIVKSYIEDTTGVHVASVKILIENVYSDKEAHSADIITEEEDDEETVIDN